MLVQVKMWRLKVVSEIPLRMTGNLHRDYDMQCGCTEVYISPMYAQMYQSAEFQKWPQFDTNRQVSGDIRQISHLEFVDFASEPLFLQLFPLHFSFLLFWPIFDNCLAANSALCHCAKHCNKLHYSS